MQEHTAAVFIVATANNIEALPPELLRKGRFDEIFFVDLPTPAVRKTIFRIHLARRKFDPKEFDLARLAEASQGYTGAEIESAIESALFSGFPDRRRPDTQAARHAGVGRGDYPFAAAVGHHGRQDGSAAPMGGVSNGAGGLGFVGKPPRGPRSSSVRGGRGGRSS